MKIVYLSPSGELGGAEKSLIDILASVSAARPDWSLSLVAGEDGPLLSQVKSLNLAATVLPFPRALSLLGDAGAGSSGGLDRTLSGCSQKARPRACRSRSI